MADLTCHRCSKRIDINDMFAAVQMPANGRGIERPAVNYHLKCLPPNLFRQYRGTTESAGSRPASRVATD